MDYYSNEYTYNENGINFHLIPTKKFKTISIAAKLKAPLHRDTITKRALLSYILKQGTMNYPSRQKLQLKLDELYGAVFSVDSSKKGENHVLSIRLEIANEQFVPESSSILDQGISLFNELLFKPNVTDHAFPADVLKREKETLKQKINAVKDEKMKYANMRLVDEMCAGEPYQLHVQGYEEDLADITPENLYAYYESLLKENELDIYFVGDFNQENLHEKVSATINRDIEKQPVSPASSHTKEITEPKEVVEKQSIQQAKLHIGYRTGITFQDEDYAALQVFNGLFGGFPSSKLFINVREKNSLAYYAASRLESHKGLLFVFSGIAPTDYEKARDIIRLQMEAMKNGDFTKNDLNETKELIVNQLLETMDHPQGLIELEYQQVAGNTTLTPEMLIDNIRNVTKEDVERVAGKINEDTIYLLTSEGGNPNE